MNLNRLIDMAMRMVMRKLVSKGVDAGIDAVSRRGKPREAMTPQERERAAASQSQARNARKLMRAGRRLTRM